MLQTLKIENYGLIDKLEISFSSGLNVLTGETGAGKSIIIGALRLALGGRLSSSNIRDNRRDCCVEAIYDLSDSNLSNSSDFADLIDKDKILHIRRQVSSDNKSRIKINGKNFTVNELKCVGDKLTDFHGPHDHQLLFDKNLHINFIDRLIITTKKIETYREFFSEYCDTKRMLDEIKRTEANRDKEIENLTYIIRELSQVPLSLQEHDDAFIEQKRINNLQALFENISQIKNLLAEDEISCQKLMREIYAKANSVFKIDSSFSEVFDSVCLIQEKLNELDSDVNNYANGLEFDDERSKKINSLCDAYTSLKRKYNLDIEGLIDLHKDSESKLNMLTGGETNITVLTKQLKDIEAAALKSAEEISLLRKAAAESLKISIEKELKDLGISSVVFSAEFKTVNLYEKGIDEVEFYISTNAGENLKPLAEIVSSGEAARIMLALKKSLINVDMVPTLIFDEIDAQIGGRLGDAVGKKLKDISRVRQVLLITHLPQIAAFADRHFKIEKQINAGKTITNAGLLDLKQRVSEMAHMLSGKYDDSTALKHAKEMLNTASIK